MVWNHYLMVSMCVTELLKIAWHSPFKGRLLLYIWGIKLNVSRCTICDDYWQSFGVKAFWYPQVRNNAGKNNGAARETVFHRISKHQEDSWKYNAQQRKFEALGNVMKHCLECLIYSRSSRCDCSRKRPSSSYDHHCETPFELSLKLCN